MYFHHIKHRLLAGSVLLLSVALTACNSDDNDSSDTALSGTAAVGAAIQMGTVTAKCQGGATFIQTVTTDNNGKWRGFVKKEALPCALQVSGGTPAVTLHSYATSGGIVNITPLTDLMIAEQTELTPSDWFAAFDGTVIIETGSKTVTDALTNAGYNVPTTGNPFTTSFNANGTGWDRLLDDLGAAINGDDNLTYDGLLDQVKDGNLASSLPEPPENTSVPQEPASVPAGFIGSHVFKYEEIIAGSGITDDTLATFEIMAGNKLKLPGGAVLENPVYLNGNTAEIIWFDESNELAYALSNAQTLVINELNISNQLFGQAGYQFYGSYAPFVETDGNVPDALKAMDGVYTTTVYYSKAGNRNNWAVADELMLSINGATGVIDVGGVYSIDPTDPSFSWTDKTSTNPMFNPHYEVLYSGIDKLLIYQRPGEPINGWRLTQEANATDGVNVAADVTPVIETHQAYFETLATQLPATLILVEQDGSNLFKAALCTGYEFSFEANGGTAGKPRLLYNKVDDSWIQSKEYFASSAAYAENSTIKSLYWAGFTLAVDGSLLTLTGIQSGAEIGVVLTNDPAMIAETCPEI